MPLVAAPGSFVEALPGSHGLPPIVQPLGHEVSHLATPGLVVARARPVEAAGGGVLPAPVQRRATRGARTEPIAAADSSSSGMSSSDVGAPVFVPSDTGTTSTPVRTLPTVSRLTIRMPDRPLTSAAVAARPASVQRSASHASNGSGASVPAPAAPGGMRRVPSAGAPTRPTVSREASVSTVSPSVTPTASIPSLESGSRRGLGAPLDAAPVSARPVGDSSSSTPAVVPVSRSIAPIAMPLATSRSRAPVQREAADSPEVAATSIDPRTGPAAEGAPAPAHMKLPELPVLSLSRSMGAQAPSPPASAAPAPTTASLPAIRPLLGARPIQQSIRVQRSASTTDDDDDDGSAGLPSPWWSSPEEQQAAGLPSMDSSGGDTGSPVVSRMASASPGGVATGGGWSSAGARPLTAIAAPAMAARPIQRSAAARPTALPAVRGQSAVVSRQASAATVAAGPSPAFGPSIVSAPQPAREIVVQTNPAAAPMSVQRTAGPGPAPVVQREERLSGSATSPAGGRTESDLEELAQALFGRIRSRLRSELIHDREAKGLTFDNV